MKKIIENFPRITGKNFLYCFTSVYMFLDNIEITGEAQERCQNGAICCGCGGCGHLRAKYIQMFDTMCGHSATLCRYDGKPSEMQKMIGGYWIEKEIFSHYSTDYTIDFLFGFVGYEYHKYADKIKFKDEIITSIDKGIPVIAYIGSALYRVITGHDGDVYIHSDSKTVLKNDDIETLFVFGNKIVPHYTVRDGLERVKFVMESNAKEGVWDGYIEKFTNYVNFNEVDLEERKLRMQRLTDAMGYAFNIYPFNWAFWGNTSFVIPWTSKFEKMRNPALNGIWEHISSCFHLYYTIDWSVGNGNVLNGLYEMICLTVKRVKEIETNIHEKIKQAIEILEVKEI